MSDTTAHGAAEYLAAEAQKWKTAWESKCIEVGVLQEKFADVCEKLQRTLDRREPQGVAQ